FSALLQGIIASGSMLLYLLLLSSRYVPSRSALREPAGQFDKFTIFLPGVMALVCTALDMKYGYVHLIGAADRFTQCRLRVNRALLYAMPVLIILVIGVPPGTWTDLAGQCFLIDWCHHLNFFIMGPALSFAHGKAFGTEIFSQYGIGWPMMFSTLSHF